MTGVIFKFIIYPSCEGPWRTEGWNQKQLGNLLLVTWFFWLQVIIYDYFSSVFCIVTKKVLLLKYRKWVSHLKNRYDGAKVVENARINFSIIPYCTLLIFRKENFKFLEVALSAVLCNGAVGRIMNLWRYQHGITHWTFTCFLKTATKALKQGVKFVQT